ncbi:MAG: hypothetical protein IJS22_08330 [Lachnospiraceae bacterium]|nr:hypothetical protein [Lachnospiraceae bacterium]
MSILSSKKYIKELKRVLPAVKEKKQFISDMTESLRSFCFEHPDADKETIYSVFGDPKEIAESFAEEAAFDNTAGRKSLTAVLIVVSFLAIGFGLFFLIRPFDEYKPNDFSTVSKDPQVPVNPLEKLRFETETQKTGDKMIQVEGIEYAYKKVDGYGNTVLPRLVSATKTIDCFDEDDRLIWTGEISTDFVSYYDRSVEEHYKKEFGHDFSIKTSYADIADGYNVRQVGYNKMHNTASITVQISFGGEEIEKQFVLRCDEFGNLN